jgi:hypothetical protein
MLAGGRREFADINVGRSGRPSRAGSANQEEKKIRLFHALVSFLVID